MFKKSIYGVIIILLIFGNNNSGFGRTNAAYDLLPVETWITDLSWDVAAETLPCETCSHFGFEVDFNLYNPNDINVNLTFPYVRQFLGNMTIELEDPNHNASLHHGGDLCAISEIYIEPGVTQKSLAYLLLIFETPDLIELPDGNYSIWVYGGSQLFSFNSSIIFSHRTNVTIDNGEIFIDYFITTLPTPTSPTIGINISYAVICISAFVFVGLLYITKKKEIRQN